MDLIQRVRWANVARLVLAVAAGLLVYPQAAHLEHFEPHRMQYAATGTSGYMARVGRWLRESF